MMIDVCTISTKAWLAFGLVFVLIGVGAGLGCYRLLKPTAADLSPGSWRNIAGSTLQLLLASLSAYFVARSLPEDPCGGAFTADAQLLPLVAPVLVAIAGLAAFWTAIYRGKS